MPFVSLRYRFRQPFRVPATLAYEWCTDFGTADGPLFAQRTERTVRWLTPDALVMRDTTYPGGHRRRIRRLVRLNPREMAWTNTHVDGPFRHSQFWYRVVADGLRRSHLEFEGLAVVPTPRALSPAEQRRRAEQLRRNDSVEWRTHLAPALEAEVGSRPAKGRRRSR
ncbi:MAG TPA: hypothetical protein VEH57_05430 [Thermoplasmata archaeon]|nr:hypothetical protein [Thermoplasmata archaeon]